MWVTGCGSAPSSPPPGSGHGIEPGDLSELGVPGRREVSATLVTTDAAGTPTTGTLAFADNVEQTKAVTNVSVGGHYALSPRFRVHAGFFTDNSPVEHPESSIFRAVDLTGFSAGVSLGAGKLTASAGVSGSSGTSAEREVGPTLGGREGVTKVKVRTINLLYAVSYAF